MSWTVDAVPDANGHRTIRQSDGSPNGGTDGQPIATVYTSHFADLIGAAPEMLAWLEQLLDISEAYCSSSFARRGDHEAWRKIHNMTVALKDSTRIGPDTVRQPAELPNGLKVEM